VRASTAGAGGDDEHLLQAGEVDRRCGHDALVDAEVALDHLGDGGDRDALGEAPPDAAGHEQVAHLDLVGALHVLHVARVFALVAGAAGEAARPGALHDHVDAAARVDDQAHVDGVARALQRRPHHAVGREHGQVGPDVAVLAIERHARDAEELVGVLADHLRAHHVDAEAGLEIEQALEPTVLFLEGLELAHALLEAGVLRGEARVVLLHVDQVDVVAPEVRDPAGERGRRVLNGRRDADDDLVGPGDLLGIAHAGAEEPERHRQREQHDHEVAVAFEVHGAASWAWSGPFPVLACMRAAVKGPACGGRPGALRLAPRAGGSGAVLTPRRPPRGTRWSRDGHSRAHSRPARQIRHFWR
jgi:hypothetical protein